MDKIRELLEKIRKEAREKTLERLKKTGRDVNLMFFTIIAEVYSMETLIEELLKALNELDEKYGKKQPIPQLPAKQGLKLVKKP